MHGWGAAEAVSDNEKQGGFAFAGAEGRGCACTSFVVVVFQGHAWSFAFRRKNALVLIETDGWMDRCLDVGARFTFFGLAFPIVFLFFSAVPFLFGEVENLNLSDPV